MQTAKNISQTNQAKRYLTQELAQIEIFGGSGKIFCKMSNLSTTGAFFEVLNSGKIPYGKDLVRLTINLHSVKRTHTIDAEVIWQKNFGFGLRFMTPEQFKKKLTKKSMSLK